MGRLGAWLAVMAVATTFVPMAVAQDSVLDYIQRQADLKIFSHILSFFPYLQLALSDPQFKGTVFAPDDSAWMSFLSSTAAPSALGGSSVVAVKDVAGALRWLAAGQAGANRDEREARLLRTWWARVNLYIVADRALTAGELNQGMVLSGLLVNGDAWQSPADSIVVAVGKPTQLVTQGQLDTYTNPANGNRKPGWPGPVSLLSRPKRVTPLSLVHVINSTLEHSALASTELRVWSSDDTSAWARLVGASSHKHLFQGPWKAWQEPHMTVLYPTAEAVVAYLSAQGATLEAVLGDQEAVDAIVGAHVVPAQRLWAWDLMGMAHLDAPLITLAGTQLQVETDLEQVWLITPGGQRVAVRPLSDLGGNAGGCAYGVLSHGALSACAERPVVGHRVEGVLA